MADAQHFCLRWNNYQSSITSAFENLRDDEDFVDVTLACDGRSLKAHRVVLSACSPYFRDLLKSTPCKHPVIVLQDVSFSDLHALVEFIYHGEVNVHQQSLSSFLKTAEVLRVSGLTQQQSEDANSHLSRIQNLANTPTRISSNHHSYAEKIADDQMFLQGVSHSSPQNNLHPTQLIRRVAAAAALRRGERHNLLQIDELGPLKRYRSDNGVSPNKNGSDTISHAALTTGFPVTKQQNSDAIVPKEDKSEKLDGKGNGIPPIDNDNVTSSPLARGNSEEVKSEPLEMICSNNNPPLDEHSNDSSGENDLNRSSSAGEIKGSLSSANDEEIDSSIPCNPPQRFLMSPHDSKFLATPGTYNFSMAALTDPAALASLNSQLQSAADLAGSPQGSLTTSMSTAIATASSTVTSLSSQSFATTDPAKIAPPVLISPASSSPLTSSTRTAMVSGTSQQSMLISVAAAAAAVAAGGVTGGNVAQSRSFAVPTSDDFRCDPCNKSLSSLTRLKRHIQNVHMRPTKEPVCNICKRGSSSLGSIIEPDAITDLNHHAKQENHHPRQQQHEEKQLQNNHFGRNIIQSSAILSVSSAPASSVRPLALPLPLGTCHRCDVCGKLLSTKLTLKRHKEQQHLQPLNSAVCNLCHKVFRTLNSLNNHKSIYHRRQKNHHPYLQPHHTSLLHTHLLNNRSIDNSSNLQHELQPSIKQSLDFL